MAGMSSLVRIVNAGVSGSQDRVDVVLRDGVVASVNPAGTDLASHGAMPAGAHTAFSAHTSNAADTGSVPTPTPADAPADETTINADGLWIIPGLWDCHTHFTQWAKTLGRLDLINARSAAEAMDMLHRHLDERRAAGTPARWYGLENSNVSFEYVPLFTKFKAVNKMQRLAPNERP